MASALVRAVLILAAISAAPCGCATVLLRGWSTETEEVTSQVTEVEAWRAAPTVVALRVVDVASDGARRQRHFAWVHGAWPAGDHADVAAILSRSCVETRGLEEEPDRDHSDLLLVAPSVSWPRLPGLPDEAALEVTRAPAEATRSGLVLRGDQLELRDGERLLESVDLPTGERRDPSPGRTQAGWLLLPVAMTVDTLTFPVQLLVWIGYVCVNGLHLPC